MDQIIGSRPSPMSATIYFNAVRCSLAASTGPTKEAGSAAVLVFLVEYFMGQYKTSNNNNL